MKNITCAALNGYWCCNSIPYLPVNSINKVMALQ